MNPAGIFSTFPRRLLAGTLVWVLFWPIFWWVRIGDISGAKSWFWIIGELNYPIAALCFYYVDYMAKQVIVTGWKRFLVTTSVVAAVMPFLYKWFGFRIAVLLEAVVSGYLV